DRGAVDAIGEEPARPPQGRHEPVHRPLGEEAVVRAAGGAGEPRRGGGAAGVPRGLALDPTDAPGRVLTAADEVHERRGALAMHPVISDLGEPKRDQTQPGVVVEVPPAATRPRRVAVSAAVPLDEAGKFRDGNLKAK